MEICFIKRINGYISPDFKGAISQIFIIMKKKTNDFKVWSDFKESEKKPKGCQRVVLCTSFLLPLGRKPFCMLNTIKLIISDAIVEFK